MNNNKHNTIIYNLKITFPVQHICFTFATVSRLVLSRGHFCYFKTVLKCSFRETRLIPNERANIRKRLDI